MIVRAPIYSISRLRFGTDGKGITSLVAFMGCPLRCRHCINSWCHSDPSRARLMSPEDLYGELMIDNIYFQMTGGGVCFGGVMLHLQIKQEEVFCRKAFGTEYEECCKTVRRYL